VVKENTRKVPKTMKLSSPLKTVLMLTLSVLLFTFAAQAQLLRANVPFAFVAGDRLLPAGEYTLNLDARSGIVQLLPASDLPLYAAAHHCQFGASEDRGTLVFHKYGDSYFLKRVKTSATREGYEFLPTRGEKNAARKSGTFEVAMVTTYDK
jgi:hypothetical protein